MTCLSLDRVVRIYLSQLVQCLCRSLWVNLAVYVSVADVTLRILRVHSHTLTIPCSCLTTIVLHSVDVTLQDVGITIILELSDDSICYSQSIGVVFVDNKCITQSNERFRIFLILLLVLFEGLGKCLGIYIASLQSCLYWLKSVLVVNVLSHCRSCQTHDEQTCY